MCNAYDSVVGYDVITYIVSPVDNSTTRLILLIEAILGSDQCQSTEDFMSIHVVEKNRIEFMPTLDKFSRFDA